MRKTIFLALLLINCQCLFAQNLGFRYSQQLLRFYEEKTYIATWRMIHSPIDR